MTSVTGTAGNDVLYDTSGTDTISGLGGNDIIYVQNGNNFTPDVIDGGDGDDVIYLLHGFRNSVDAGDGDDAVTWIYPWTWSEYDDLSTLQGGSGIDTLEIDFNTDIETNLYWIDHGADFHAPVGGELHSDQLNITDFERYHLTGTDAYADDLGGANGDDILVGLGGNDVLSGGAGDDGLNGGSGDDRLYGEDGNDYIDGGTGADVMRGGFGDDRYYVDNAGDAVVENSGEGIDTVYSAISYALGCNVENLNITGSAIRANGNNLDNRLVATAGDNVLNGGLGADTMQGGLGNDIYYVDNASDNVVESSGAGRDRVYSSVSDTLAANVEDIFLRGSSAINATGNGLDNVLRGNSAANVLTGGAGADDYRGGTGADTFVFHDGDFAGLTPSTSDRIIDFSHAEGDKIDLSIVDANSLTAGQQDFAFIGSADFHHVAGELRYEEVNGNTYVYGDTNGDGVADLMIRVDGLHALTSGDFVI